MADRILSLRSRRRVNCPQPVVLSSDLTDSSSAWLFPCSDSRLDDELGDDDDDDEVMLNVLRCRLTY